MSGLDRVSPTSVPNPSQFRTGQSFKDKLLGSSPVTYAGAGLITAGAGLYLYGSMRSRYFANLLKTMNVGPEFVLTKPRLRKIKLRYIDNFEKNPGNNFAWVIPSERARLSLEKELLHDATQIEGRLAYYEIDGEARAFRFAKVNPAFNKTERLGLVTIGEGRQAYTAEYIIKPRSADLKDGFEFAELRQTMSVAPNNDSARTVFPIKRIQDPIGNGGPRIIAGPSISRAEVYQVHQNAETVFSSEVRSLHPKPSRPKWDDLEEPGRHFEKVKSEIEAARLENTARMEFVNKLDQDLETGKFAPREFFTSRNLKIGGKILMGIGLLTMGYGLWGDAQNVVANYKKENGAGARTKKAAGEFGIAAAATLAPFAGGIVTSLALSAAAEKWAPQARMQWDLYCDGRKDGLKALRDSFYSTFSRAAVSA
jgi:hypothetical protein